MLYTGIILERVYAANSKPAMAHYKTKKDSFRFVTFFNHNMNVSKIVIHMYVHTYTHTH